MGSHGQNRKFMQCQQIKNQRAWLLQSRLTEAHACLNIMDIRIFGLIRLLISYPFFK